MAGKGWIQKAAAKMKAKGTTGSFGKATAKNISKGKAAGGLQAKKAIFAQNMARIAKKNKGK